MEVTDRSHPANGSQRRIGPIGTTARVIVGILLPGSVIQGHLAGPFRPAAWTLGLLGFPTRLLGWQWLRAQRTPTRLQATGLVANVANIAVFLALYLTRTSHRPWRSPATPPSSSTARQCCWLLGRDDQR
jgi:hypothetical protein